jgi:Na+-translocating ferredoxin:NAD+ oxidoreductase subunit B
MPEQHTIQLNSPIIGPGAPKPRTARAKKRSDFHGVSDAHLDVAEKLSSPLFSGPPLCDEFVAFVQHLFTEEEAQIVRRLGKFGGKTAAQLAKAIDRPVEELQPILDRLDLKKRCISGMGPHGERKYRLMPVYPGIFEMCLIGEKPETLTPWHRRFIELFDALYETGYFVDYAAHRAPFVRFLPLGSIVRANLAALPSDKLEVVLDRYDAFGVGHCQCRMSEQVKGRGCDKPLENCLVMGEWARKGVSDGYLREVTKRDALAIKAEAETHGLVSWIMNVESSKGQCSCSCCACCCHGVKQVSQFNSPALAAPPHFLPRFDFAKCVYCGKCARQCPLGAITVAPKEKTHRHLIERCIGCGLCAVVCDAKHAVSMEPVPDYRLPPGSWFGLISRNAPNMARNMWGAWRKRKG